MDCPIIPVATVASTDDRLGSVGAAIHTAADRRGPNPAGTRCPASRNAQSPVDCVSGCFAWQAFGVWSASKQSC